MICRNCGANIPDDSEFCSQCGANLKEEPQKKIMPMKWYKFLTFFILPMSAFSNIASGFESIFVSGTDTHDMSAIVDVPVTVLKKMNIFMGITAILISIFIIYTWSRLLRFKKNSLYCLSALYIANGLVNIVYALLMMALIGDSSGLILLYIPFASVVSTVFLVVANTIYFKKRSDYFVNS